MINLEEIEKLQAKFTYRVSDHQEMLSLIKEWKKLLEYYSNCWTNPGEEHVVSDIFGDIESRAKEALKLLGEQDVQDQE